MDVRSWKTWAVSLGVVAIASFFGVKLHRIDQKLDLMSTNTKRFHPSHVVCKFDHNPEWEVQAPEELITFVNVITQQPFHWLAKGFQAYAFLSQDGEYVLKFFQQQRLREKPFLEKPFEYLFSKSFREKIEFKQRHREEIFSSSKLAFEEISKETGILYVHLNKTDNLLRGIRLCDSSGQAYKLKSDQVSFILQRRAHYVLPTISDHMKKGDVVQAKARLNQIFDLLLTLAKKGIVDSDYALIRNNNIGFAKDRAIYIDTGHLAKHPDLDVKKQMDYEFKKRLRPLYDWLSINYPDLAKFYEMREKEIMQSLDSGKTSVSAKPKLEDGRPFKVDPNRVHPPCDALSNAVAEKHRSPFRSYPFKVDPNRTREPCACV